MSVRTVGAGCPCAELKLLLDYGNYLPTGLSISVTALTGSPSQACDNLHLGAQGVPFHKEGKYRNMLASNFMKTHRLKSRC